MPKFWILLRPVSAVKEIPFSLAKRNYQLETIMITNEMLTGLGVVKLVKTL